MQDQGGAMGATVLGFLGQMTVWSLILLLCLEALGVNVNSLIASLGVGGIAVALAAQNVLGDLFASISILLDKPFVAGDAIQVGDFVGTVERIGVKTTRLRSVDGEEIVMGNSDLVSSRIRNYKRVNERRVVCQLGVAYQTASNLAEAVPGMLREIVQGVPQARFDRAHLKALADSSILFELVYCVQSPDFNVRMDAQQAVNLAILRRFKREGIEFAYPTHTVHLVDGAPARAALAHAGAQKELSRG
jgi:small-conductance mechanosensitive channel